MAEAFDYQSAIRDRLIDLIRRLDPTGARFRPASVERKAADRTRRGVRAQPGNATENYFPTVEVLDGRSVDDAYNTIDTIDGIKRPGEGVEVRQEFLIRVTHKAENQTDNAKDDRTIVEAIRAGGRQLANPDVADSDLPYVVRWGPVTIDRPNPTWHKRDVRNRSLIAVPVTMELRMNELSGDVVPAAE